MEMRKAEPVRKGMPKKRKNSSSKAKSTSRLRSRSVSPRSRRAPAVRTVVRFIFPLSIAVVLGAAILFMALSGYKTATASGFFTLREIEVRGTVRTPSEDVRRVVASSVEKQGVWNAELSDIRERIEKFPFVKTAAVSRLLPSGIRVNITERVPAAIVQLSSGKYLIDGEGTLLAAVKDEEKEFPFLLKGWDESKTEAAVVDNLNRLKLYTKMLEEWKQFDLAARVREVNLANPRVPVAVVEDSGRSVGITLARDNLGKGLKTALEALTGKGDRVRSIDAAGVYPVIQYLEF
jgi:cell division septal protein FtsQ